MCVNIDKKIQDQTHTHTHTITTGKKHSKINYRNKLNRFATM